jgi:hypothetical protein
MGAFRFVAIALTALLSSAAWPCAISQTAAAAADPLGYLERSELVMTATVVQSTKVGPSIERVELDVQRAFKGGSGQSRLVLMQFIGGTCDVPLQTGKQYLLFARPFSSSDAPGQYEIIGVSGEPATEATAILERARRPGAA